MKPAILCVAALLSFFALRVPPAQAANHNVGGWAWSGNTGWIVLRCDDAPDGCTGPGGDYGLDFDANGNLSGWAWSVNGGWICVGAACVGAAGVPASTPSNDDYCVGHVPCARYDTYPNAAMGQLHGWGYVVGLTEGASNRGWISFNCTDLDPAPPSNYISDPLTGARTCDNDYAVSLDEAATQPAGHFTGYAWNGNADATGNGWIQFGCGLPRPCGGVDWGATTTWVKSGWTSFTQAQGIYEPPSALPGSRLTSIPISFGGFSAPAGATVSCSFRMSDGQYKQLDWNVASRVAKVSSWSQSYALTALDPVVDGSGNPVLWTYASPGGWGCRIAGSSDYQAAISNTIAVHPASWTFTGEGGPLTSDSNRAKYCLDGNLGSDPARGYFLNSVQCDTEGDLALSLLKARGVTVEVVCSDDVDDDANLQKDCVGGGGLDPERACRGITYLCITHPPAPSGTPPQP